MADDILSEDPAVLRESLIATREKLAASAAELEAAQALAAEQAKALEGLQTELRAQAGIVGGLRANVDRLPTIEEELEQLRVERDELAQEVKDLRARLDQMAQEREDERSKLSQQLETERAAWAGERTQLQSQIDTLKAQVPVASTTEVPAKQLAQRFLDVFEELANPEPSQGRPYTAALTNLEVEAKVGVDRVEQQDPDAPSEIMLKTIDPASAMPDTLSTVRMRFGVVGKIAPREIE